MKVKISKEALLEQFVDEQQCEYYYDYIDKLFEEDDEPEVEEIETGENDVWLKQVKKLDGKLPVNCFLDKVRPGCGATTMAITNEQDVVIVSPYNSLLENKKGQHENLICYSSEYDRGEAKIGLERRTPLKVMVTYDSTSELLDFLKRKRGLQGLNVLVDEAHDLLTEYDYRDKAINRMLESLLKYKKELNITFVSATLPPIKLLPKGFEDFPIKRVAWKKITPVKLDVVVPEMYKKRKSFSAVKHAIAKRIRRRLEGKMEGNLYFFCNSVGYAASILGKLDIKQEDVKMCCADTLDNRNKLDRKCRKKYTLAPIDAKREDGTYYPVNFITTKYYEGADCYDPEGRAILVSENTKQNTMLDVSTKFAQALFRLRKSKYRHEATHLAYPGYHMNVQPKEIFTAGLKKDIRKTIAFVNKYNSLPERELGRMLEKFENHILSEEQTNRYLTVRKQEIESEIGIETKEYFAVNESAIQYAYYAWHIANEVFSPCGLSSYYNKLRMVEATDLQQELIESKEMFSKTLAYKSRIRQFLLITDKPEEDRTETEKAFMLDILTEHREIMDFYHLKGKDGFEKIRYRKKAVMEALQEIPIGIKQQLLPMLKPILVNGSYATKKEIKRVMQELFDKYGYKKNKAKVTMLKEICPQAEIKRTTKDNKEVFVIEEKASEENDREEIGLVAGQYVDIDEVLPPFDPLEGYGGYFSE